MKFRVKQIDSAYWRANMALDAHVISFGEHRHPSLDKSDFVIIAVDPNDNYSGFITCKEMDAHTLYWQFGGPMPNYRGTIHTVQILGSALHWCRERYRRVHCKVENTNYAMIKMAMHLGFVITGISNFEGKTFLELSQELLPRGKS